MNVAGGGALSCRAIDGGTHLVEVDGLTHRFSRDDAGILRAPATALVVGVDVSPGDSVTLGDRVVVVEAMKMEVGISAPMSGIVSDVFVARNVQVDGGAPLLRIEPLGETSRTIRYGVPTISLAELAALAGEPKTADRPAETVRAFILGLDVPLGATRRAAYELADSGCDGRAGHGAARLRRSMLPGAGSPARRRRRRAASSRERFNQYLRSLDVDREGMPTWFVEHLTRAVVHYGVDALDVTPALEDALMRIFVAQRTHRRSTRGRRGDPGEPSRRRAQWGRRSLPRTHALDRVIKATQRRHPALASIARESRHRLFDRPLIDRNRDAMAAAIRQHVLNHGR